MEARAVILGDLLGETLRGPRCLTLRVCCVFVLTQKSRGALSSQGDRGEEWRAFLRSFNPQTMLEM